MRLYNACFSLVALALIWLAFFGGWHHFTSHHITRAEHQQVMQVSTQASIQRIIVSLQTPVTVSTNR